MRFYVLMAVTIITVFWDVTLCRVVEVPVFHRNLSTTLHGASPQKMTITLILQLPLYPNF